MNFKELIWNEQTDMRGRVNMMQASVEIKLGDKYLMHTLFRIFEDNNHVLWLGITGDFEHDRPKFPVNTFENGKFIANGIYQSNMQEIYNNIKKLID